MHLYTFITHQLCVVEMRRVCCWRMHHNFHFRVCLALTAVERANRNCGMLPAGFSVSQPESGNGNRLHLFNSNDNDNDLALLTSWQQGVGGTHPVVSPFRPIQAIVLRCSPCKRIFKIDAVSAFRWKIEFSFSFSAFSFQSSVFISFYSHFSPIAIVCRNASRSGCVNLNLMSPRYLNKLLHALCLTFCYFCCWLVELPPESMWALIPHSAFPIPVHLPPIPSLSPTHLCCAFWRPLCAPAAGGSSTPTNFGFRFSVFRCGIILDKWPHSQSINLFRVRMCVRIKFSNALIMPFGFEYAMRNCRSKRLRN